MGLIYIFNIIRNSRRRPTSEPEFLVCRHCGTDISLGNFLLNKLSPSAVLSANASLFGTSGVLVQDLINPLGVRFRVVAVRKAQCASENVHVRLRAREEEKLSVNHSDVDYMLCCRLRAVGRFAYVVSEIRVEAVHVPKVLDAIGLDV